MLVSEDVSGLGDGGKALLILEFSIQYHHLHICIRFWQTRAILEIQFAISFDGNNLELTLNQTFKFWDNQTIDLENES